MKIFGEKGLGNILKILLQIIFAMIIVSLITMPFILKSTKVLIFYPNVICLLAIMYQFINLFNLLKLDNPFCESTEKLLSRACIASVASAIVLVIQLLYEIILVKVTDVFFIMGYGFMIILFIGVTIALYMLKELFNKATKYKKENDLTI